jgi:hypothetical protein
MVVHEITGDIKFESEPIYATNIAAFVAADTYMYENFKQVPPFEREYRVAVIEESFKFNLSHYIN